MSNILQLFCSAVSCEKKAFMNSHSDQPLNNCHSFRCKTLLKMNPHKLSISAINCFFSDDMKCISRAENSLSSGHLLEVHFNAELNIIKGCVAASMSKNKKYNVAIYLAANFDIQQAECTCARGMFLCHHMGCVVLYAHYNISKTDVACSWKPKPGPTEHLKPVLPASTFSAVSIALKDMKEEPALEFKKNLKQLDHNLGMLWLMSDDPKEGEDNLLPYIENILVSQEYFEAGSKRCYLEKILKISPETIFNIAEKTKGQRTNPAWLIGRKHRLTASMFGDVLKACNRQKFPPSLFTKLTGSYNLEKVKQVQWGIQNEPNGLNILREKGIFVEETGLWLHECGFLGASPDGLISSDGVVEVKCPYTHRNTTLKEVLKSTDIAYFENNCYKINQEHLYYHQIQGQLHFTKRDYCILILYTTVDYVAVRIEKDLSWSKNIEILKNFYFEQYIPHISIVKKKLQNISV